MVGSQGAKTRERQDEPAPAGTARLTPAAFVMNVPVEMSAALEKASRSVGRLDYCTSTLDSGDSLLRVISLGAALRVLDSGERYLSLRAFHRAMLPAGRLAEAKHRFVAPRAVVLAESAHELANRAYGHEAPPPQRLLSEYHDASGRPHLQIPGLLESAFAETAPLPVLLRAVVAYIRLGSAAEDTDARWVGRAALALVPCALRQLRHPALTPELYLDPGGERRAELEEQARCTANWEPVVAWHLNGIATVAEHTVETMRQLRRMLREHHEIIDHAHPRRRNLHAFLDDLMRFPCCTAAEAAARLRVSQPTAREMVACMERLNILKRVRRPHEDSDWNAVYEYARFLDIADRPLA